MRPTSNHRPTSRLHFLVDRQNSLLYYDQPDLAVATNLLFLSFHGTSCGHLHVAQFSLPIHSFRLH